MPINAISIKYNYYLNFFLKDQLNKKNSNSNLEGPKILIRDNTTRQLSTYTMLNRFIYFKEEINKLFNLVNNLPTNKKNNLNLNKYNITNNEQDYLTTIRDILEIFRKPTIKFQTSSYSTIYLIIPYINRLYNKLEDYREQETNSYINLALKEASNKLIKYYPIKYINNFNEIKDLYLVTTLNP